MGLRSRLKKLILGRPDATTSPPTRATARPAPPEPPPAPVADGGLTRPEGADAKSYVDEVVHKHPVVLFMKGSPAVPMCGFSATAARILQVQGVAFEHVDVLLDPEVRQAVKEHSSWPTIPQAFVHGELVGGSDILMQLHESGELDGILESAKT